MKIFSPVLKGTTTVSEGTTNLSGSFTGSLQGTAATASYVVTSQTDSSQNTRLSTIESVTGSFASTGSNAFNGSQTITGSLTATGTIIAQTLVVQTITSSVEYVSGSNRFGSTTGNTHEFTGSVLMSGSQTVNGALSGTSATFSGNLAVGTTLSSWGSPFSVTQYPYGSYSGGTTSGAWVAGNNNYYDGSNYRYVVSDYASLLTQGGGDFYIRTATTGTAGNVITWNERFRVTNSGNVGIGTTAPFTSSGYTVLDLYGASSGGHFLVRSPNVTAEYQVDEGSGGAYFGTRTNHPLILRTNTTERMRITSSGIVSVNSTSPNTDSKFFVKGGTSGGDGYAAIFTNNAGSTILALRNDQLLIAPGVYSYNYASTANVFVQSDGVLGRNSSSLKYKKNIIDYDKGLDYVLKLRPVLYESKNPNEDGLKFTGFIAEEVDKIGLTELVHYDKNKPDSLHYPHFVALLTKSVQELKAELDTLRAQIS